jgi:hypothetical protein
MMNLFEMMQAAQGGNAMANLGHQFKLTPHQTQNALEALLPALSMGLHRQTQSPDLMSGLAGLMLGHPFAKTFETPSPTVFDTMRASGNDALGQLFGSEQVTRAVAAQAEAVSGINAAILQQMLPVITAMVMGGLVKAASNQGLGGLLGQMAGMMPGLGQFPGQFPNVFAIPSLPLPPPPPANPFGDLVSGMFGGQASASPPPAPAKPASRPAEGADDTGGPIEALGDMWAQMLGLKPEPPPPPPPEPEYDPAAEGLEALTSMFGTGQAIQEHHQANLQSIFDAMLSGQRK